MYVCLCVCAVGQLQRMVKQIGTSQDSPELRDKMYVHLPPNTAQSHKLASNSSVMAVYCCWKIFDYNKCLIESSIGLCVVKIDH